MSSTDATGVLENMIAELDVKLSQLGSDNPAAALAELNARIAQIGAQIQAIGTQVSAQASPKAPTAADARRTVQQAISSYNAGVASGKITPPSLATLAKLDKLIQAAVDDGNPPDPEPEVGSLISEYQQQVTNSGPHAKRTSSSTVTVPADYDVDYNNDGEPDFAVVHLSPEMVLPPLPYTPWGHSRWHADCVCGSA